ncbi:hypothetical protein [Plantactinospora sonchi]|uniref:Uncharacterized protein n=1 Tax=Plantactinospora sonchi TaxID=1544735 RepID=A0ABU7RKH7_9ACTN
MRRRLLRVVAASALATALVLPSGAQPARAVDPGTIATIISFASQAYGYFSSSQSGGMTIEQATTLMIQRIQGAQNAIIAHMDQLATAEAKACARHHVLEFADIEEFSASLRQRWAQDVTACVTLIDSLWGALGGAQNSPARHELGMALGAVGPIALVARARAGFSTVELRNLLVTAFDRVRISFTPYCYATPDVSEEYWQMYPGESWVPAWYTCFSVNGDLGIGSWTVYEVGRWAWGAPVDYPNWQTVFDEAGRRSAYGVAVAALAQLRP